MQALQSRVQACARNAGRDADSVRIIAVSKTFPREAIAEAVSCGQTAFGENYVQEALEKIAALPGGLEWHMIGPIQSNKTKSIAEHFAWVHSVDRERIARRLSDARPPGLPSLNVCIQVNVSGEASKTGVAPGDALPLARAIAQMPRLRLRGLMAVPEPTTDTVEQRARFRALRELRDRIITETGIGLDTLSMGMSDDLEAAIAEGSTMVRVGRAIFGARPRRAEQVPGA
jgi:pyridoxal phosphate enzyme (YggS family)